MASCIRAGVYPWAIVHKVLRGYPLNDMESCMMQKGFLLVVRDKYHSGRVNGGVRGISMQGTHSSTMGEKGK
jgi:hypothetical protein